MVEILLQNGAEVNATDKVNCDNWRDVNEENACQGGRNEGQECENGIGKWPNALIHCPWIRLMKFHGMSLHIHACGDRMRLMMNIV